MVEEKIEAKEKESKKKLSEKEFGEKVVELAKQGMTAEKIGERLRKEGIHPKEHGKKISKILIEEKLYSNPDLKNVEKKLERVAAHFEKNRQDKKAMREKDRIFAQLRIMKSYLKV